MSQTPNKIGPKMCKSPKNSSAFQNTKFDKIEYESLNTNCTVVGSNNLSLIKKQQINTSMSPAYSNPSPGYTASPYSSPASLKSPSPSLKPPTPQPSFPVMQLIHNSLLTRPVQNTQQQNIIKLKPHLNILPKPSASPQPSPKPSVSPQIVLPTNQQAATIMPTAQPLLLNQMPMLTTSGVQFILRPQTAAKISSPIQSAATAPQGLILQPSGQPLLQIQSPRSQPMVRVLTNGVQLAPSSTAYVTQVNPSVISNPQSHTINNVHVKKKPKVKIKKKLDLANIMKLSGIGDEDDIQFESDTSQSEPEPGPLTNTPHSQSNVIQTSVHTQSNLLHTSDTKKMGSIQFSGIAQPTLNTSTPMVQVLNQNFQSGVIASSASQAAAAAHSGIPFNPFITPNFTINNGLMVQRSGGFKLTVGEDGRLILQHDPTLNQDLQSQLILQSIFGLNGGLVLHPSVDQQTVQQTVQTIQQQSVQTIQQQTVQSQTIQTVQQALQPQIQQQTVQQTIQHQTVQSQPLGLQQPLQIVQPSLQPQPSVHHSIQSQVHSLQSQIQGQIQSLLQNQTMQQHQQSVHQQIPNIQHSMQSIPTQTIQNISSHNTEPSSPVLKTQPLPKSKPNQLLNSQPPVPASENNVSVQTSYVVNLTPDQLDMLKRNGQLTINGQTIFMQRPKQQSDLKKLSPKSKSSKKINKTQPHTKPIIPDDTMKESQLLNTKDSKPNVLQTCSKHIYSPNNVQTQSCQTKVMQPNVISSPHSQLKVSAEAKTPKLHIHQPKNHSIQQCVQSNDSVCLTQDTEKALSHITEESNSTSVPPSANNNMSSNTAQQRIHTIQLTPQKQQQLKNVQLQIQTLSARMTSGGDSDMQNALKMLFSEQQKILASGKLLPPDKVYYHNNQLTIVNPSTLGLTSPQNPCENSPINNTSNNRNGIQQAINPVVQNTSKLVDPVPATCSNIPPQSNLHSTVYNQELPQRSTSCTQQITLNKNSLSKKAHIIEAQLNLDQNEAVKPDIHTPFKDKKDACIRLIRFHCMDQPVLSQKDLAKADEIFELTARHFIGKYARMVDKYKVLLMKESMRQVPTSELMMLDRLFLADEQQSLIRLRQEVEESHLLNFSPPLHTGNESSSLTCPVGNEDHSQDDYDEWACIQRELGCFPSNDDQIKGHGNFSTPVSVSTVSTQQNVHSQKRTASSDSRLETLKRFRVEKHSKKTNDSVNNSVQSVNVNLTNPDTQITSQILSEPSQNADQSLQNLSSSTDENEPENNSIDEQVQSAIDSILNLQQNTPLDLDSILS